MTVAGGPCGGPCNYRWRQAKAAYDEAVACYDPLDSAQSRPQPPQVTAVPGNPWCGGCQATIRRELGEIGTLASILSAEADGYRPVPVGERVAGTPGRRSPSPDGDTIDELYSVLFGWECAWWETRFSRPGPPDRRGFLADRLTSTIAWLLDHFDGIITYEGIAVPFGDEVRDWNRSLRGRTKTGTVVRQKPLRCPGHGCGQLSLWWREGAEYVECRNPDCGAEIRYADYEEMERQAAAMPAA
jgi:hypothetical protein